LREFEFAGEIIADANVALSKGPEDPWKAVPAKQVKGLFAAAGKSLPQPLLPASFFTKSSLMQGLN